MTGEGGKSTARADAAVRTLPDAHLVRLRRMQVLRRTRAPQEYLHRMPECRHHHRS